MDEAAHTKGPWTAGKAANGRRYIFGADGWPVLQLRRRPPLEMEANKNLILAAEDLLEFCKKQMALYETECAGEIIPYHREKHIEQLCKALFKAGVKP